MTHASLCKKTYEIILGFLRLKASESLAMGFAVGMSALFVAPASLPGQEPPPLTISTGSLPNGVLQLPYLTSQQTAVQVSATGGLPPYSFFIGSGSETDTGLPPGLQLSGNGQITGTPTSLGNFTFNVSVTDSDDGFNSRELGISVVPCTPAFLPASPLPPGDINTIYPQVTFTSTGCPGFSYTYTEQPVDPFNTNDLPPGLKLSTSGTLSGKPTGTGNFTFLLTATDQNQNVTQIQYDITINALPTITTGSPLPNAPVGVAYNQQITATGGVPPYTFSMDAQPPGIVNITPSGGVLFGTPTTPGTYNFNIGVTDSLRGQTTSPFKVTFVSTVSQIQVAPLSLTFNADQNGNAPGTQAISVVPATGATPPVNYRVVVDGGQSNTPAPSWITVTPLSGAAPAGLVVSVDQGTLAAGSYAARIQVLDVSGIANDVAVTLNVASTTQQLTVAPGLLNFAARSATPGNLVQELAVSNTGGGSLNFTTSVVGSSPWITNVTSNSSATTRNTPVFIQVQVNTSGLQVGAYHDAILVSSAAGNTQIPVSLFVAASGPILAVDTTGVLFQAIQGGGSTVKQIVEVLNLGDPNSTVNWNATLMTGSNWLNLVASSGTATSTTPGTLTLALTANATQLTPGPYYAIVKITDSNSLNSPQYVAAVLNLQPNTAAPGPDLAPVGLFFTTSAGGSAPAAQQVQINTSSASAVTFTAATTTSDGASWLSVTPASGNVSGQASSPVSVSVDPTGLAAGIYSGDVNISIGTLLQSVNVTFVVQPTSSSSAISRFKPEAAGCSATKLAITETGLANNFAVPAGWPATLIVQLNNDCAGTVTNGTVTASFSNGDPRLNLTGDSLGNYSTTWQPGAVNTEMVITLNAKAGSLQPAIATLNGGIAANQTPPPVIVPGGAVNNLNPVVGAALAPGTIAQVYGSGFAPSPVSTGPAPLPKMFENTYALVGTAQAPLYFLSGGQINIQIPNEVPATQQVPVMLSVNNALTLPLMVGIVPAAPGVLSSNDGPKPPSVQNGAHIIAQHSADFSLVTASKPAKPGEVLIMYLVGLGATNPSVPSGAATPASPLHPTTDPVTVKVGSQTATVSFAGLSPFFVGLYQINFQVPVGANSGELEVDVTQNSVAANPTLLPVSN
jgi:uncharacterized protein (TIGR03437 family)